MLSSARGAGSRGLRVRRTNTKLLLFVLIFAGSPDFRGHLIAAAVGSDVVGIAIVPPPPPCSTSALALRARRASRPCAASLPEVSEHEHGHHEHVKQGKKNMPKKFNKLEGRRCRAACPWTE